MLMFLGMNDIYIPYKTYNEYSNKDKVYERDIFLLNCNFDLFILYSFESYQVFHKKENTILVYKKVIILTYDLDVREENDELTKNI